MKRSESHECPKGLRCALGAKEQGYLGSGQVEAAEVDGGEPEYWNDCDWSMLILAVKLLGQDEIGRNRKKKKIPGV